MGRALSLATIVGGLLALLFACVMGLSIMAVLLADYMQPGRVMSEQARQTLQLCAAAGFVSGLIAWWLQRFAAERAFVTRLIYGVSIFFLVFGAVGGTMIVAYNYIAYPNTHDFSLSGIYFASLGGFYSFAVFLVLPLRIALFGLLLAAGLVLALVGPHHETA